MTDAKRNQPTTRTHPASREVPVGKPLKLAQGLSVVIMIVGVVMLILGLGVATGLIKEGWGFPMSPVPNWGRPWGIALIVAGAAQVLCPLWLLSRPKKGSIAMMIASGLCVLIGTPIIITTIEIFYNLFQEKKDRPDWVDAGWAYYMMVQIAICVALYKAYPPPRAEGSSVRAAS